MKPLDQKQLRVWDQYLDWQVEQGDHQRIVVLFERCLIPCALYEQFWAKYARYLEDLKRRGKTGRMWEGLCMTCLREISPRQGMLSILG